MKILPSKYALALLILTELLAATATLDATVVTISGAGSAARLLISKKTQLESDSGQTLIIKSLNSQIGIQDLLDGNAQLAIISGPDKALYKYIGFADEAIVPLRTVVFHRDRLCFIVSQSNSISSLTKEQLIAIFTCKITNWKEVGGPELAIEALAVDKSVGYRISANAVLWGDKPMPCVQETDKSANIVPSVSHQPGAISFAASSDVTPDVKIIKAPVVPFDMSFVSKGEPTAAEKAVIDAARSIFMK
jgi:phosphate transport system substrate-binding protein